MSLANGFFVATEFALVSSRPTRIDQLAATGNRAARMVQRAKSDPTRFISGTQLGVTVASLMLGWIGEQTFAELIQPVLDRIARVHRPGRPAARRAVEFDARARHRLGPGPRLITFFHITLGEQVPKILALQHAEPVILFAVQPVVGPGLGLPAVHQPAVRLFTNLVLRTLGFEYHGEEHAVHSPEELQLLVYADRRAPGC